MKLIKRALLVLILGVFSPNILAAGSVCYGSLSDGRLENGVKLPSSGKNFESYSTIAESLGRTYVHEKVLAVIIEAYKRVGESYPGITFKYGETGFKNGGEFRPHRTHQNGLSVDFFVPARKNGKPELVPTHLLNKWGYNLNFDSEGKHRSLEIDFDAMAAHLKSLVEVAVEKKVKIKKVYFAPELQKHLLETGEGDFLAENLSFNEFEAWVRHDEHYHVDFEVPCLPLGNYH